MVVRHLDGTVEEIDQTTVNNEVKKYEVGDVLSGYTNDQGGYIIINIIYMTQDHYLLECIRCETIKSFGKITSVKPLNGVYDSLFMTFDVKKETIDKLPEVIGHVKKVNI